MVNETSIYKDIQALTQNKKGKIKLSAISRWLHDHYGIELIFCRIHGNRWAFYTGSESFVSPVHKYQLDDKWGIMTEDMQNITNQEWNNIIDTLKDIIKEE